MRVWKVAEDEKCGCCNWRVQNLYLVAETQEEADRSYKEYECRGLCADCLVELIIDEGWEVVAREGDGFPVTVDERLIRAIAKAYKKLGYDLPETRNGWSDIINDLLQEKIIEDFGEEI